MSKAANNNNPRRSTPNISQGGNAKEDVNAAVPAVSRRRGVVTVGGNATILNTSHDNSKSGSSKADIAAIDAHHQSLTRVDYQKIFSPKIQLEELKMPSGLKFRPLATSNTQTATNTKHSSSDLAHDHVQAQLWGLPGALKMDYQTSQKYFGSSARDKFFDRYKWMDHQRDITLNNPEEDFDTLYFEREKTDPSAQQAFALVRPVKKDDEENDDVSKSSSFQSRFKLQMSASGRQNETLRLREAARRSGTDSPEDFDELDEARMLQEMGVGLNAWEELEDEDGLENEGHENEYGDSDDDEMKLKDEEIPVFDARTVRFSGESKLELSGVHNNVVVSSPKNKIASNVRAVKERPKTASAAVSSSTTAGNTNMASGAKQSVDDTNTNNSTNANNDNTAAIGTSNVAVGRGIQGVRAQRRLRSRNNHTNDNSNNNTENADSKAMQRARNFVQGSSDQFSTLILEDLMRKRNVVAINTLSDTDNHLNTLNHCPAAVNNTQNRRKSDLSLVSASTVSTLGLLLGQRTLNNNNTNGGNSDISHNLLESPRSRFIAGCIQRKINPRASLLLRKNMTKQLNLQHLGMGDTLASLLAECVSSLPFVQSINVADNMLTDDGLGPLILAARDMKDLLELNLSLNEIGPIAAKALFDYLVSPTCPLERLILNSADVDDFECGRFIEAVKQNRSLRELDLSCNKIGTAENLNTVMPDIVTGGEAIADLLQDTQCRLTKLNLSWNMIRLGGAYDLAASIAVNDTLTYLDLSYNSLATEGGVTLGVSLLANKSLQTLILICNSLDSVATFTICAGIIENRSLRKVCLDGNPIGETGMRALMLVPVLCGNRVKVTAARCNCNIKDPNCWFNFDKLLRDYDLDMSIGFERAVAIVLLHLIAGHHSYIFSRYLHEPGFKPGSNKLANPNMVLEAKDKKGGKDKKTKGKKEGKGKGKKEAKSSGKKDGKSGGKKEGKDDNNNGNGEVKKKINKATQAMLDLQAKREAQKLQDHQFVLQNKYKIVDLVQISSDERLQYFDARQKEVLASLEKMRMAASNIQFAVRLFQEVDTDGSGELDKEELGKLMAKMGFKMSEKRLSELMAVYDVDMGGKIELHEFLMLLKSQHQEATQRIKELTQSPVMALKTEKNTRYIPPEVGALHITIIDGFAKKKQYRVLTACDREYVDEVAQGVGGVAASGMVAASMQGAKLRLDEGLTVAETMLMESGDKVATVKKLLLQMNDFDDARHLITSIIDEDRADMIRLRRDLGPMLKAILGNPNGYYVLDLSKEIDRLTLEKLLEISATNAVYRCEKSKIGYGRVGDISQKGPPDGIPANGFSSFRNEMFNGEPMTMSAAFCSPIPLSGVIDFDFSCTPRPPKNALVLTDNRVVKILLHHFLLEPRDAAVALHRLHYAKLQADKTLGCNGVTHFECSMDRARQIGECCETFYNNIHLRCKQFLDSLEKEASTEVDESTGQLKDLFERDKHFPIPLTVSDWFIRLELAELEKLQREKLEREKQLERERKFMSRYQIYGNTNANNTGNNANGNNDDDQGGGGGNSVATDTDEEEDEDDGGGGRRGGAGGSGGDNSSSEEEDEDGSDEDNSEEEEGSEEEGSEHEENEDEEEDGSEGSEGGEGGEGHENEDEDDHQSGTSNNSEQKKKKNSAKTNSDKESKKAAKEAAKLAAKLKKQKKLEAKRAKQVARRQAMDALRRDYNNDHHDEGNDDDYLDDDEAVYNNSNNNNHANENTNNLQSKAEKAEEEAWEKEFEMLKEVMRKKKAAEDLLLQQQQQANRDVTDTPEYKARLAAAQVLQGTRRKNIAHHESFMIPMTVLDDFMEKFKQLLTSSQIQSGAKAHRIVDMLEDMFARAYLCCRHVALIVECFAYHGYYKQTKYHGTYRVELVIGLFARIVDLHNFEFVLEVLSPAETAALYCRLGWLSIYNPCKPEGSWELDMSRREERIIAKTLCVLATHEPGDNWTIQTFRWMRSMESMPGWQLTQPWLTEEGMPMRGLVNICYYSGEGKGKKDCKPYVAFRKALLNLVLIEEDDIVEENMRSRPAPAVSVGDRAFNRHYQLWDTYLAPEFFDPTRKR